MSECECANEGVGEREVNDFQLSPSPTDIYARGTGIPLAERNENQRNNENHRERNNENQRDNDNEKD